jgi:hypothetical protein
MKEYNKKRAFRLLGLCVHVFYTLTINQIKKLKIQKFYNSEQSRTFKTGTQNEIFTDFIIMAVRIGKKYLLCRIYTSHLSGWHVYMYVKTLLDYGVHRVLRYLFNNFFAPSFRSPSMRINQPRQHKTPICPVCGCFI